MILSKKRVEQLLEIFSNPKSITPYDNSIEKQELNNASIFIRNYHLYGPPPNATEILFPSSNNKLTKSKTISSENSQNNPVCKKSIVDNKNLTNPSDLEAKQSIIDLKLGQQNYKNEKELDEQKKIAKSLYGYNNYNNSQNQILYSQGMDTYTPYESYQNYSGINPYSSNINQNNKKSSQILKYKSLRDIPQNPNDVIINNLPANFSQSINPISSPNIKAPINSNLNNINEGSVPIVESYNEPPVLEEIDTTSINKQNEVINEEPPQEEIVEEVPPVQSGKYKITAFNGPIKLPEGYSTDDEAEYNAIQMINEDLSTWKLQIDKPDYKIYSKPFYPVNEKGEKGESRMFYLDATINFPASEVNKQINSFNLRKEWEESLKKGKLIKEEDLGNGMKIIDYYGYIKMPLIFADRDIVVRKKIWENYNGEKDACLNEIHSIENPDYPPKEKPVRATLENKSKYIKPIDANKTKFYYVNKFDMKVSVGASMMESKGADGTEKWFKNFLKHLG